jgi:hypothetical protein
MQNFNNNNNNNMTHASSTTTMSKYNSSITAKISTLINSASNSKVSKEIEKIILQAINKNNDNPSTKEQILDSTKKFKFSGVGNYNMNEDFDLLNDVGLLWRLETRTGGWDQCGYDFVPWSGFGSIELETNNNNSTTFLDLSFFKGKLQNVNLRNS